MKYDSSKGGSSQSDGDQDYNWSDYKQASRAVSFTSGKSSNKSKKITFDEYNQMKTPGGNEKYEKGLKLLKKLKAKPLKKLPAGTPSKINQEGESSW